MASKTIIITSGSFKIFNVHCPVLYVLIRGELEGGKPYSFGSFKNLTIHTNHSKSNHLAHMFTAPVLYVLIRGELEGGKPFAPLGCSAGRPPDGLEKLQKACK